MGMYVSMKQLLSLTAAGALFAGFAFAETWTGTVIDTMCKAKDPATHTRKCALGCAKSGFGIVLSDGKFVKFDDQGNTKTVAMLESASKDKDLKVKVSGKLAGDTIQVESISLQ